MNKRDIWMGSLAAQDDYNPVEGAFQAGIRATPWFDEFTAKYGEPNLNDPNYDYRAAWAAGARPTVRDPGDNLLHWPSQFKGENHPNRYVGGVDTKTNAPTLANAFDVPGEQSTNVPGALLNAGNWFLRQAAKPEAEAQQDVRNVMGAVHNVMGALAAPVLVPGQMMKPNPYPPGSEEAAFYDASKIAKAVEWAPEMSLNMMGGGVAGTGEKAAGAVVGSGPIRKAPTLPMDEASRLARATEQGYTIDAYHGTRSPVEFDRFETGSIYNDAGDLLHPYSQHPNSLIGPHFAAEPTVANKFAMGEGADWLKSRFTEGNPAVYPVKLKADKVQKFKSEDDLDTLLFRQKSDAQEIEAVIESRFPDDIEAGFAKYDKDKAFREQVNREAVRNENNYDEPSSEVGQSLADAVRGQYEKAGVTAIQYPNAVEGGTSYISVAHPRSRFAAFDPANKDSGFLLGSGATDKRAAAALQATGGIRAYHSSPHDFDKFDLAKIGSGEGAQAYGHGLYFAESPAVSGQGGQYWQQFAPRFEGPEGHAAKALEAGKFDRKAAIDLIEKSIKRQADVGSPPEARWMQDAAQARKLLESGKPIGPRTYEVNINADPAHMLDWDKALYQQPDVYDKIRGYAGTVKDMKLQDAYKHFLDAAELKGMPGSDFYQVAKKQGSAALSQDLREAGIPGIKYLDQGSRLNTNSTMLRQAQHALDAAKDELAMAVQSGDQAWIARQQARLAQAEAVVNKPPPTSNYVIFDPGIIDIMKKYVVPGAIGAGGMGALAVQDRYE